MSGAKSSMSVSHISNRSWCMLAPNGAVQGRLSWIVAGWLVCQTAALAAGPIELAQDVGRTIGLRLRHQRGRACARCTTATLQRRPMTNPVSCRAACAPLDAALLVFGGSASVCSDDVLIAEPLENETSAATSASTLPTRVDLPDSPPPRL